MVPPPGDCCLVVERVRRVAGEVFFKKGHMPFDWRRRASILVSQFVREIEREVGSKSQRKRRGEGCEVREPHLPECRASE